MNTFRSSRLRGIRKSWGLPLLRFLLAFGWVNVGALAVGCLWFLLAPSSGPRTLELPVRLPASLHADVQREARNLLPPDPRAIECGGVRLEVAETARNRRPPTVQSKDLFEPELSGWLPVSPPAWLYAALPLALALLGFGLWQLQGLLGSLRRLPFRARNAGRLRRLAAVLAALWILARLVQHGFDRILGEFFVYGTALRTDVELPVVLPLLVVAVLVLFADVFAYGHELESPPTERS